MYGYFPVIRTCDVVWSVSRCNTYPVYEIHGRKVQHSWGDSTDHTNELKGRKFTFVILRKEERSNTHSLSYNAGILLKHWDKALRLFGQLLRFQRKVEFDCSAPMELNNSRQSSLYLFKFRVKAWSVQEHRYSFTLRNLSSDPPSINSVTIIMGLPDRTNRKNTPVKRGTY